jgi:hypothetical protein
MEIKFADWYVTIAFYTAVHYIEAMLSLVKPNICKIGTIYHSKDHTDREKIIKAKFNRVYLPYSSLYQYSRVARYENYDIDMSIRTDAKKRLDDLKKECEKYYS